MAERLVSELEIVDFDIVKIMRSLGRNWHYEPRDASWIIKSRGEGENGARTFLIVGRGNIALEWHHSGEEESDSGPNLFLQHVISIEPNLLDDNLTWEDVDSGKVDAPGIVITGKSGNIFLIPIGDEISLQGTVGDLSFIQYIPNPGGSQ